MRNARTCTSMLIGLLLLAGCATQTRTVRTETTYEPVPGEPRAEATTRTTTETNSTTEQEGGFVSGAVDIVGKTIALPFRAVGGLVDLIF